MLKADRKPNNIYKKTFWKQEIDPTQERQNRLRLYVCRRITLTKPRNG